MKSIITGVAITLTGLPLLAQSSPQTLNADGNYIVAHTRNTSGQPGVDIPGAFLRSFDVANATTLSGYAPRVGQINNLPGKAGQWANLSGGNAEMYGYDFDGDLEIVVNLTDVNDSWPGYDGSRNQILCVNAFDDTISGFDNVTGAPAFRVSTPTAGPVGCAWDSTRDIVWYSDWTTNEVVGLDAAALQGGVATVRDRFSTANQITRIAGVAYNCLDDTLISGGRDQGMQIAYNAGSKAVVASWSTLGSSTNDPQGCGMSPESGVATTDFSDLTTRVHEATVGIRPGAQASRGAGGVTTVRVTNYATAETRAIIGWANGAGRSIIKGVQTCLSASSVVKAGVANLNTGAPPSGVRTFTVSGSPVYLQAATLPTKLVTNVVAVQ